MIQQHEPLGKHEVCIQRRRSSQQGVLLQIEENSANDGISSNVTLEMLDVWGCESQLSHDMSRDDDIIPSDQAYLYVCRTSVPLNVLDYGMLEGPTTTQPITTQGSSLRHLWLMTINTNEDQYEFLR